MIYLYKHKEVNEEQACCILPDGYSVVRTIPIRTINDLKWLFFTKFSLRKWILKDKDGNSLCIAYTNGKTPLFPFMTKESIYIGKCFTPICFRGKGYYPILLKFICAHINIDKYMLIHSENTSSIKGAEKANFKHIGTGIRKNKIYHIDKK